MILVEGMDNSGKSTLCKSLSKKFGLDLDTRNRPKDLDEGFKMVSRSVFKGEHVIYDRHVLISEIIYGPILRGKSIFGEHNWDLLFLMLTSHPLIVYCRPPDRKIFEFGTREQMEGVISQSTNLLKRYDWMMNIIGDSVAVNTPIIYYDYTEKGSTEKVERYISKYVKEMRTSILNRVVPSKPIKDEYKL